MYGAVEHGYRILCGQSASASREGVGIYPGCPVVFCTGDLVDDYRIDQDFGNDHQLLFEMELTPSVLRCIDLHPVFIEDRRAGFRFEAIALRVTALCAEMGATVEQANRRPWMSA